MANVLANEDDTRDWQKAQKKLVSKSIGADIQKELKKRKEEMNWDLVAAAARKPKAIICDKPMATSLAEADELEWYKPWSKVLDDSKKPFFKWFVGGQTNIVHNALDRHQKTWRKNKLSLVWVGEKGDVRTYSYFALHRDVCRFANVLKAMGVRKGDRVTIYLPRIPELVISMLACAKIGAIHSVVYGGFSVEALHGRILDSGSKLAITADGGWLSGKIVKLKDILDEALQRSPTVEHVIVVKRTGQDVCMDAERDLWYHDLMNLPIANTTSYTEEMDAVQDPLRRGDIYLPAVHLGSPCFLFADI